MSDIMLLGVLRRPLSENPDPLELMQLADRARQAADRIEQDAATIEQLEAENAALKRQLADSERSDLQTIRERDEREDFINELLDKLLGTDRAEWSNLYDFRDAMEEATERIESLKETERLLINTAGNEAAADARAVAWIHPLDMGRDCTVTAQQISDEQVPLYTHPAAVALTDARCDEVHEALEVALSSWREKHRFNFEPDGDDMDELRSMRRAAIRAALGQPVLEPMTDREIADLWSWSGSKEAENTATTQQHAFARAVERRTAERLGVKLGEQG